MGNWFFITVLLFLFSCGGSHHKSSPKKITVTPPAETGTPEESENPVPIPPSPTVSSISTSDGSYPFIISSLNKKVSWSSGSGSITLSDSELRYSFRGKKFSPLRSIYQSVYEGECPNSGDDRNGDGYIDIEEAKLRLGRKILTLDSNLDSENPSQNVFPRPSLFGKFSYEQNGSRNSILENLTKKYGVIELDLRDTIILFQGTMTFLRFPNSVASADQLPVSETLPVGCASISRER